MTLEETQVSGSLLKELLGRAIAPAWHDGVKRAMGWGLVGGRVLRGR